MNQSHSLPGKMPLNKSLVHHGLTPSVTQWFPYKITSINAMGQTVRRSSTHKLACAICQREWVGSYAHDEHFYCPDPKCGFKIECSLYNWFITMAEQDKDLFINLAAWCDEHTPNSEVGRFTPYCMTMSTFAKNAGRIRQYCGAINFTHFGKKKNCRKMCWLDKVVGNEEIIYSGGFEGWPEGEDKDSFTYLYAYLQAFYEVGKGYARDFPTLLGEAKQKYITGDTGNKIFTYYLCITFFYSHIILFIYVVAV